MEYQCHDERKENDEMYGEEERSPIYVAPGGEAFDLAALRLSPLTSPAMTTAPSGSEGLSVLSDGMSPLATEEEADDKEGRGEESRGGDDDEDHDDHGDASALCESKGDMDDEDERRTNGGRDDKDDCGAEDEHRDPISVQRESKDENASDSLDAARVGDVRDQGNLERGDNAAANEMPLVSSLPLSHSSDEQEAASSSRRLRDHRDIDSDDDMTVECASPRDLKELEDAQERITTDQTTKPRVGAVDASPSSRPTDKPPAAASGPAAYSLNTIFPVVYEQASTSMNRHKTGKQVQPVLGSVKKVRMSTQSVAVTTPSGQQKAEARTRPRPATGERDSKEREAALQDKLQAETKSLAVQLQVLQTDRKQLAQRNSRLKSQLELLTADLVRTKADAAKWKTENELYAAKMPKLQAELSEETTQVDEKHAQGIQAQLEITQLRAKVQVLQTRAGNLDVRVEKLESELRVAKKDVRRRAIVQQQSEEKLKRIESELHEVKASHAHELQLSKQKLTTTVQRLEHERIKALADLKKTHLQQLDEARSALGKMTKKWKEQEHANAGREQELLLLKKRIEEFDDDARMRDRQAKTTETLLARAERTETSLRNQVAALKVQVQVAERQKSKALRSATAKPRLLRVTQSSRSVVTSLMERSPRATALSSDTERGASVCSCCRMMLDSMEKADRQGELDDDDDDAERAVTDMNSKPTKGSGCARCHELETAVTTALDELTQVRTLHASELKVQATAYECMLAAFRGGASPSSRETTLTCA